jgi:gliding motility-associated-like protein
LSSVWLEIIVSLQLCVRDLPKMKRFLIAVFVLLSALYFGQIPTSGLIGAWPFSGNANDISTSANHGTVSGAALVADRCGNPNSAYSFNGSSDYIVMLTPGPTGTVSRSVSFWAMSTNTASGGTGTAKAAFDYGSSSSSPASAFEIVSSYCAQGVGVDNSTQAVLRGDACLNNGLWHHIVVVYDPAISTIIGGIQIYIDGVIQTAITCNVSGTNTAINTGSNSPVTIGRAGGFSARYFAGSLDDFYLYNRALTSSEVLQLYTYCPPPISGNTLVCVGSTNVYTVTPLSGASYTWTLPSGWTGTSNTNTISVVAGSGSGIISVVASSASCSYAGTPTLNVTVQSPPSVMASTSNNSICVGGSATLTASGANTYTWLNTSSNSITLSVSPSVTTVYTVVGKNTAGCSASTTINQVVVTNPTVAATSTGSLACFGNSATLTGIGATSYTWQPINLTGSVIIVSPSVTTIYTVTGLIPAGCLASSTIALLAPTPLSLTISSSSPSACLGTSILLTANSSGGTPAYTYTWSGGPSTNTMSVAQPGGGTYVYTVNSKDANNCSATATAALVFYTGVFLNTNSLSICPGTVGTLTVSGANTYTWQPGNFSGSSFTVAPSTLSTYTVTGTAVSGCTANAVTIVAIKAAPTLSFNTYTINCANLGSATVTAGGTAGPYSFSWTPTAQTGSVATGLFPGNYTVDVFDASSGCVFTPTTNFAPLIALTGTVSSTPSLTCNGATTGTASISLSGGSGTQSYTWTNISGPQNASLAISLNGGVHTVNVSDGLTFCSVTQTFFISQPPAFTLNIGASSASICMGGSITFTALNSGGTPAYSYTWTSGPSTNTINVSEPIPGTYTYVVTSEDANNCIISSSVTGKFVPNPTVSVSNTSVCPLVIGTLTASGATTYFWLNNPSASSIMSTSPPSTTEYTVVGSTASCTTSATGSIIIKPPPTATFSSNAPVCQGDSLKLFSLNTQSLYLWTGPSNFTSNAASVTLYSVIPTISGNYTLKVTAGNSCTASVTKSLTVNATPPISISANTVCETQTLHLFANFISGATYSWIGPQNTSTLQNPVFANATPAMTGVYFLTITSASGCTNTASILGSVVATPVPSITTNSQYCVGDNIQLNGSGGISYSWVGPNFFSSNLQSPVVQTAGVNASGQYSLYAYVSSCYGLAVKTVSVNQLPTPTANNNGPVCESTMATFNSPFPALSYTWTGPAGFTSNLASPSINTASLNNTGVYTLSITDNNNCGGSAATSLSVIPAPTVTARDVTVCLESPATLTASGGAGYSWTGPGNYSSTQQTVFIAVVNPTNTGNYVVVVSGTNVCTSSASVHLTGILDTLPMPVITAPKKVCMKSALVLQGTGGAFYSWTGPNNFAAIGQSVTILINDSTAAGVYTLHVRNKNNCTNDAALSINVYPLPKADLLTNKGNLCVPFCSTLSISDSNVKPLNYEINNHLISNVDSTFSYCFQSAGSYTAKVNFADSNQCSNTSTLIINAYPKPSANFEYSPTTPLAGIDHVQFLNTSREAYYGEWKWFLQGNDSVVLTEKDPSMLYDQAGTYPVVLIAKNIFGCIDTTIKVLIVEDEFFIFVPNAFTPNGDGLNDVFQPKGTGVKKYNLEIYSRWGEKIFHTIDFYTPWDGTFKGKECKSDIYFWKIVTADAFGNRKERTGHISLLRAAIAEE